MHPNPAYHEVSDDENLKFARQRGFGTWVCADQGGSILAATAPFFCEGTSIKAHLVRTNPLALHLFDKYNSDLPDSGVQCTLIISGPDCYISPDWYGLDDQVPTWNYICVHIHGTLKLLPDVELRTVIDTLSTKFESRLQDIKAIWKSDKVNNKKLSAMMKVIVPIELTIKKIEGTWKLGQAKPQPARARVAGHMQALADDMNCDRCLGLGMELNVFGRIHEKPFVGKCEEICTPNRSTNLAKERSTSIRYDDQVPMWAFLSIVFALMVYLVVV